MYLVTPLADATAFDAAVDQGWEYIDEHEGGDKP
jgi:hypothetical protein